ncbi:hypothetical protein MASR1M97_07860 [Candidatus Desulfobacillus denitrificans]
MIGGIELGVDPDLHRLEALRRGHGLGEVAEGERLAADGHVEQPAGVAEDVPQLRQAAGQRGAAGHAVAHVAVARGEHRQVDGEHQRPAAGGLGAGEQFFGVAAVADDVELEPERRRAGGTDFLDGADGDGAEAERHAGRMRRARRLHLAAACVEPGQPDRSEDHRLGERLAEHGGGGVDGGGAAQHALVQAQGVEVVAVGGERQLVVGAAVDVVEEGARQAPLGQQAVIGD